MRVFKDFSETDLNSILQLCANTLQWDAINETLLREKILDDPDFDPQLALTLWEDNHLIAFLFGVVRTFETERTAYIKCFAVDKSFQRQGAGTQLFREAEQRFGAQKAMRIRIGEAPVNYLQPGIDTRYSDAILFLETLGYKAFDTSIMMQSDISGQEFSTQSKEDVLAQEDIELVRAGYDDMQDVFEFVESHFPRWRTQMTFTYNSLPVSLHIARRQGTIIGFAAHNTNNFGNGWFGPIAVLPEFQRKGIGSTLLKRCMQDMKDWGLEQALIPWAEPRAFFEQAVQARVVRNFIRLEKEAF